MTLKPKKNNSAIELVVDVEFALTTNYNNEQELSVSATDVKPVEDIYSLNCLCDFQTEINSSGNYPQEQLFGIDLRSLSDEHSYVGVAKASIEYETDYDDNGIGVTAYVTLEFLNYKQTDHILEDPYSFSPIQNQRLNKSSVLLKHEERDINLKIECHNDKKSIVRLNTEEVFVSNSKLISFFKACWGELSKENIKEILKLSEPNDDDSF